MHEFDYKETPRKLLTPEVVNMLTRLHELKGKQDLFIEAIHSIGFISWRMGRARFAIGDVVCLFMTDERRVHFNMMVTAEGVGLQEQAIA